MAVTYSQIATTTTASSAADVTFSSIPSTYTDLIIVIQGTAAATGGAYYQFNGDTGSNYSYTYMYGNGTSAFSGRVTGTTSANFGNLYTTQTTIIGSIMNYSNTTTNKTTLGRHNNAGNMTLAAVGLWRSTSAISSIKIFPDSTTFGNGTTISLYGILAA